MLGQCIDIAQPDLCCAGGFTEWTKILALTSSFGVLTVPHVWGSGIAVAAALQAIAPRMGGRAVKSEVSQYGKSVA